MRKVTKTFAETLSVLRDNRVSPMSGVSPRDSDTELIIQILQLCHDAKLNERQLRILRGLNFESITRARRKLQEQGQYLPSPEVAKKRRLKSYEVQQVAPSETAGGIQRRIEEN